jgi:putative flippase GtrA
MDLIERKKTIIQMIRYGLIGALTFVIDISVLSLSTYLLHLSTQLGVTLSFIAATAVHFTLNKIINFRSYGRRTLQQLRTYVVTVLISYCLTMLFMTLFVDFFGWNLAFSKAFTVVLNALWGFPAQKYLTFSTGIRSAISKWLH